MMTSHAIISVVAVTTEPDCTNQGFITWLANDRIFSE